MNGVKTSCGELFVADYVGDVHRFQVAETMILIAANLTFPELLHQPPLAYLAVDNLNSWPRLAFE
jgi:hypothetical protein